MPEPGERDPGGNPEMEGILAARQQAHPPLFFAASELEPDAELPFDLVDVIETPEDEERDKVRRASVKLAGPAAALIPAATEVLGGGAAAAGAAGAGEAALGAGAAGAAGMGAAEAAGGAGLGSAVGGLMRGAMGRAPGFLQMHGLNDIANRVLNLPGTAAGGATPSAGPQAMPASFYSHLKSSHELLQERFAASEDDLFPTSHGEIPADDSEDPEKIDPNEHNDGTQDDTNGLGGSVAAFSFDPNGEGMQSFVSLLPMILGYLGNDDGANDPSLLALHNVLDSEHPGYLDQGDDQAGADLLTKIFEKAGLSQAQADLDDPLLPDNEAPHDPQPVEARTALNQPGLQQPLVPGVPVAPGAQAPDSMGVSGGPAQAPQSVQGKCAACGATINPGSPTCAQCGAPNAVSRMANFQGPNTDEQKAAVSQLLQATGRGEEIPDMITQPWNYADELSQITGQPAGPGPLNGPPPQVAPPGAVAPPGVDPAAMMGAPPGAAPPGAPPMAPAMASMERATFQAAMHMSDVDNLAPNCPNCGSHTTGILSEDGNAGCKRCGHTWEAKEVAEDPHYASIDSVQGVPAADQEMARDISQEQDSSHTWVDTLGQPLINGQEYKMHSAKYDIPDIVRIDSVKPDSLNVTLTSEYGLDPSTEITPEDLQMEGYTFEPLDQPAQDDDLSFDPQTNMDAPTQAGPSEQTDLSTPHMMASVTAASDDEWWSIMEPARRGVYGPWEDLRAQAEARIQEMIPPEEAGIHGISSSDINHTIYGMIKSGEIQPVQQAMQDIPAPQQMPQTTAGFEYGSQSRHPGDQASGADWLFDGLRTAGARFSPSEQRGFIDEAGVARNSDALDLSNTHYDAESTLLEDGFLW